MNSPKRRKTPKSRRKPLKSRRKPLKSRRKSPKSRRKSTKSRRKSPKSNRRNNNSGGLSRWFNEEWIDVCQLPRIVKCGRNKAERKNYPYCRPRRRINANTPKTAREISKEEIKRRCSKKKKNPYKKVYPKKKTAVSERSSMYDDSVQQSQNISSFAWPDDGKWVDLKISLKNL